MEQKQSSYIIPLAIIIAGAFIGGGLAFGLSHLGVSGGSLATNSGNEAPPVSFSDLLPKMAQAAGVDMGKLQTCIDQKKYDQKISDDAQDAVKAGGQGTPYSIVIDAKGNKISVSGAYPYENMKAIMDAAVKGVAGPVPANNSLTFRAVSNDDHIQGVANAPVTLIEYSDLQCPFCHRFHPIMQQIMQDYKGQVRWVYRHFPLTQIHPQAQPRAEASECANEQGKFWQLIDEMMKD